MTGFLRVGDVVLPCEPPRVQPGAVRRYDEVTASVVLENREEYAVWKAVVASLLWRARPCRVSWSAAPPDVSLVPKEALPVCVVTRANTPIRTERPSVYVAQFTWLAPRADPRSDPTDACPSGACADPS